MVKDNILWSQHAESNQMMTTNYLQSVFLTVIEEKKLEIISQEVRKPEEKTRSETENYHKINSKYKHFLYCWV